MKLAAGLGIAATVVGLVSATVGAAFYYQTDDEANAAHDRIGMQAELSHNRLAAYDEIGKLELELQNAELEIKYLLGITEHRPLEVMETDRLEYLRIKRTNLEERLRDLQSGGA